MSYYYIDKFVDVEDYVDVKIVMMLMTLLI